MTEEFPLVEERRLVVVSSRGPITHHLAANGSVSASRSAGGLASAFLSLARLLPFSWIAAAITPGDRVVSQQDPQKMLQLSSSHYPVFLRLVQVPKGMFRLFYEVIANSLLWRVHHYLYDVSRLPDILATFSVAWSRGYVPVNQAFAKAIVDLAEKATASQPVVLLQDYQLFLVAAFLRPQLPRAIVSHFLHIPWPGPRYWMMLPRLVREAILKGLGNCDVVGLQTEQDARNLLDSWELSQKGAVVDREKGLVITPEERLVRVRAYPISVDVNHLEDMAQHPRVLDYRWELERGRRGKIIVRVDRLDPIKNIVGGFLAYERLLEEHPELHGKVQFHALLVPSRQDVAAYRRYRREVERAVGRINAKLRKGEWQPIITYIEENYERGVALLREYDVLVVNSLMDGMNLVAKEGSVLNRRKGVLVLSATAGAYRELAEGVLTVGPGDIASLQEALYRALAMSDEERERKASLLRDIICQRDIGHWLRAQLQDLEALA